VDLAADTSIGWQPAGPLAALDRLEMRGAHDNGLWRTRNHLNPVVGDRNSLYLPCFRLNEGPIDASGLPDVGAGARPVGRNDVVTLTDGAPESPLRVAARLRWGDERSAWCAFDEFVEQRVRAEESGADVERLDPRGHPRVLKFPCGELPDEMPEEMEFGRSTINGSGVVPAYLDELHVWRHWEHPLAIVVDAQGVSEEATEISLAPSPGGVTLEGVPGYDGEVGLVSLDGELIVYRGLRTEGTNVVVLENCARGMFGTKAAPHARGGYGRFVPDVWVTYLDGSVTRDAAALATIDVRGWPREGCVRILREDDAELIHFTRRTDQELLLPESLEEDAGQQGVGLLRGRFGTDAVEHEGQAIVIWQPFRYWDRFLERRVDDEDAVPGVYEHPEGSFVEVGRRAWSGFWHRLSWLENLWGVSGAGRSDARRGSDGRGDASGFLDIVALMRFSSAVPWDSDRIVDLRGEDATMGVDAVGTPVRPRDHLYLLDDPDAANRLGLESETAEVRFYFVYRPGAFVPQDVTSGEIEDLVFENSWKQTPRLQRVSLEYTSRTSTLTHGK
jgi:hypothetical protein